MMMYPVTSQHSLNVSCACMRAWARARARVWILRGVSVAAICARRTCITQRITRTVEQFRSNTFPLIQLNFPTSSIIHNMRSMHKICFMDSKAYCHSKFQIPSPNDAVLLPPVR
jgi:hypothetical protein